MKITVAAPAKINLSMHITGKRTDGYHTVETVMQTVSLTDIVTVETGSGLCVRADVPGLPTDAHNTAYKAAKLFCTAAGIPADFTVTLQKQIPMQAGLAGGSADAAGVLAALDILYPSAVSAEALQEMAAAVGADVPFCLCGKTALATGVGTQLSPLPAMPDCYIVIAKPHCGVSTAAAYAAVDAVPFLPADTRMQTALMTGDLSAVGAALSNRFEDILRLPAVAQLHTRLLEAGACGACMTGSGSAVFGLFATQAAADAAIAAVRPLCETVAMCRPFSGGPQRI